MNRLPLSIVADASLAVKWVVAEDDSPKARLVGEGRTLLAPELMLVECANILWKHQRRGEVASELASELASAAFVALQNGPFVWTRDAKLVDDARRLASDLNHPVYDCLYIALALRNGVPVVTADRRLAALAQKFSVLSESLIALESLA